MVRDTMLETMEVKQEITNGLSIGTMNSDFDDLELFLFKVIKITRHIFRKRYRGSNSIGHMHVP